MMNYKSILIPCLALTSSLFTYAQAGSQETILQSNTETNMFQNSPFEDNILSVASLKKNAEAKLKEEEATNNTTSILEEEPDPDHVLETTSQDEINLHIVEVYSQDDLNTLIAENKHLQRVKADECQLVEDIQAHAVKIKEPAYQYLWGDMLAWGVCVDRNAELGMYYIHQAAKQGLLAALEQLGRYYEHGTLVLANKDLAIIYYREAALQGMIKAQINYIRLLNQGYGSPYDYQEAYHALLKSTFVDKKIRKKALRQLAKLATKMPGYAIKQTLKESI